MPRPNLVALAFIILISCVCAYTCPSQFFDNGTACERCEAGSYCSGDNTTLACSGGSYSLEGWSACLPCPAGSYCNDSSSLPIKCDIGNYSAEGSSSCTSCELGSYCVGGTKTECGEGYYQETAGQEYCSVCPYGSQCPGTTSASATDCANPLYGDSQASSCVTLASTEYYSGTQKKRICPSGFFLDATQTSCTACEAGKSCTGITTVSDCTTGTVSSSHMSSCLTPDSLLIRTADTKSITDFELCSAGQYRADATTCTDCTATKYCPNPTNSTNTVCPSGEYTDSTLGMFCFKCPPGSICSGGSKTNGQSGYYTLDFISETQCEAGYYCSQHYNKLPVPSGTYTAAGATTPTPCTEGKICGTTSETNCPAGSYSFAGNTYCNKSLAGFELSSIPYSSLAICADGRHSSEGENCSDCYAGRYSPNRTVSIANPSGYYSTSMNQVYPQLCPMGHSCSSTSKNAVGGSNYAMYGGDSASAGTKTLESGYYQALPTQYIVASPPGKNLVDDTDCGEGSFCIYGSSSSCPSTLDTWQLSPKTGNFYCVDCGYNMGCWKGTITDPRVCLNSSRFSVNQALTNRDCVYCPEDTSCIFRNQYFNFRNSEDDMIKCTPGNDRYFGGSLVCSSFLYFDNFCPVGYYPTEAHSSTKPSGYSFDCISYGYAGSGHGLNSSTYCSAGSYSGRNQEECLTAMPGFQTPRNNTHSYDESYLCSEGFFCPPDFVFSTSTYSLRTSLCPYSTYARTGFTGGRSDTETCIICEPGTFCPGDSTKHACPEGYICERGSIFHGLACPIGFYYDTSSSDYIEYGRCLQCPEGKYCAQLSTAPLDCPDGYKCGYQTFSNSTHAGMPGTFILSNTVYGCTPGHFCPVASGNETNCPAGFYSGEQNNTGLENCDFSLMGKYISTPEATTAGTDSCLANHFCPEATVNPRKCPPGTFNSSTGNYMEDNCYPCSAGTSCSLGTSSVEACAQGHYCLSRTWFAEETPCPAHTYASATNVVSNASCSPCNTAGKYCNEASVGESSCEKGFYCPGSQGGILSCPPGTYSNAGFSACLGCPAGHICPTEYRLTNPTPCPIGYYMSSGSSPGPCLPCSEGKYTTSIGQDTCGTCADGQWSGSGSSTCFDCPAGFKCVGGVKTICPAGYFCPVQTSSPSSCTAGHYCPEGSIMELKCPPGTASAALASSCVSADAGRYTKQGTSAATMGTNVCSAGHFCELGSKGSIHKPCPPGTQSTQGVNQFEQCVPCTEGYYCPGGSSDGYICPYGHYCPTGTAYALKCPRGTYRNETGSRNVDECFKCPAGDVCSQVGLTQPDLKCDAGYYCLQGANVSQPVDPVVGGYCSEGYYCPRGAANQVACEAGTFNVFKGCRNSSECLDCPFGFICDGNTGINELCPAGAYCPGKTTTATLQYPAAGYHTIEGQGDQIECMPGNYTPNSGWSNCSICMNGSYCPSTHVTTPTSCTEGKFCPNGTIQPFDCPEGTFRATTGARELAECTPCSNGKYCDSLHQTSVTDICDAGFFCEEGAFHSKPAYTMNETGKKFGPCPPGHYCPPETTTPFQCGAGNYTPSNCTEEIENCFACTPGKYCPDSVNVLPAGDCAKGYYCSSESTVPTLSSCEPGHYCPIGSAVQLICPEGAFQNESNKGFCYGCPEGRYCSNASISDNAACSQGFYCPLNTSDPKAFPCEPGTYGNRTGLTQASECTLCDSGSYCMHYGLSAPNDTCTAGYFCYNGSESNTPISHLQGGVCTAGQICPQGSSNWTICPDKYVCNEEAMDNSTLKCDIGYMCGAGIQYTHPTAFSADTGLCPHGEYCIEGARTNCTAQYFQPSVGAGNSSYCLSCPYGKYCQSDGLYEPTSDCPPGYYCEYLQDDPYAHGCEQGKMCPTGSIESVPCEAGYFQSSVNQSTCDDCTSGNYCTYNSTAGTASETTCPLGYICNAAKLDRPVSCAIGQFQNETGQTACKACEAGHYCNIKAMVNQDDCPPGYYCPVGTINAKLYRCPKGYYCPANSTDKIECPAGKYCRDEALSEPTGNCSKGYYCFAQSTIPNPTDGTQGNICAEGYYCPDGINNIPCSIGTYNELRGSENETDCKPCPDGKVCNTLGLPYPQNPCPAGQYCAENASPVDCSVGYMCPEGTVEPILCMPGTYQNETQKATCNVCDPGYYCNFSTSNITEAVICPPGYYCPSSTANYESYPCPEGTYSNSQGLYAITQCTDCDATKYCLSKAQTSVSGSCSDGYTCPTKSQLPFLEINLCQKNYYCISGTEHECASHTYTYGTVLGATESDNCMPCLVGKLCPTHDSGILSCPAGSTCVNGTETPCDSGHYCPTESFVSLKCARGNQSTSTGNSECSFCPSGTYCDDLGTVTATACDSQFYCLEGSTHQLPCDYGKKANSNACENCPAGQWCWKSNVTNIMGSCNDSFICSSGADSPTPFNAGVYNSTDPNLNNYNGRAALGCHTNNSLPDQTRKNTKCPAGTFMPSPSSTDCTPCPPGYYCDTEGLFDISDKKCSAGYICLGGSTNSTPTDGSTGRKCSINNYCTEATGRELRCEDGKKALAQGQSWCEACDSGYSCTYQNPHQACMSGNTQCVEGTSREPLCPLGTYNNNGSGCVSCPAGLYCVDGRSEPAPGNCSNHSQCCTAGYLCTGGSKVPKPTSEGGKACDAGYYCPEGATAIQSCPLDRYIFTAGCKQESDCTSCMEGYICFSGNPVPTTCYEGKYCPTGITGAISCPEGTYGEFPRNKIVHDCISCPGGYLCPSGSANYVPYKCPMGEYCFQRSIGGILCPYATYSNTTGLKAKSECKLCPVGYYCNSLGLVNGANNSCVGGQLCAEGTAIPPFCPQGYYCSNITYYLNEVCPVNYYCPPNTTDPIACVTGESCPEGSPFPIKCVSGQISTKIDGVLKCESCPAGTYSTSGKSASCQPCEPGYVCLGSTNVKHPWKKEAHYGYKCPKGAYCPQGSSTPTLCPAGTYNPKELSYESKDCLLCEGDTFNPTEGSAACLPCGDNAYASKGASKCECEGKNRAFLITDSSCRCKPGYQYLENGVLQNDVNSKVDCQPIVYPRCTETQVRSHDGKCRDREDCSSACSGSSGVCSQSLGVCECVNVQKIDSLCNQACRDEKPKMTFTSDGRIRVNTGSDTYNYNPTYLTPKNLPQFNSEFMSCPAGAECNVHSVRVRSTGRITSTYGLSARLAQHYVNASTSARRRLSSDYISRLLDSVSSDEILDPVICIHNGDTTVFEIDGNGHYPVYQKDSLLNSNPDFDYGAFKILAEKISAQVASDSSQEQFFGYTFTAPGRYYFTDSIDTEKTLVVYVTKDSEKCPNEGAALQSKTAAALSTFGLSLNQSIILEPDYIMLAIILVSFLLALALLLFLMKWVTEHMWKATDTTDPEFRETQKEFDASSIKYLTSSRKKLDGRRDAEMGINQYGIYKDPDRQDSASEVSFIHEMEGVNLQKLDELDPFIIEKILENYQEYKNYLQKELLVSCERQSKQIEELSNAIDRLKFLLNERYEKLIGLLRLDVDYARISNIRIKKEERMEEDKKGEKRAKPSDVRLSKNEEKRATDVLKQIVTKKKEADVVNDLYRTVEEEEEEQKPSSAMLAPAPKPKQDLEEKIKIQFERRIERMDDLDEFDKEKLRDEFYDDLMNLENVLAGEREQQELMIRRMLEGRRKRPKKTDEPAAPVDLTALSPDENKIKEAVEQQLDDEAREKERHIEERTLVKIKRVKDKLLKQLGVPGNLSDKEKDIILGRHQAELEEMMRALKLEKEKNMDDLQRRIERRKQEKAIERIREHRDESEPQIIADESEPEIEIPKEIENAEFMAQLKRKEEEELRKKDVEHQRDIDELTAVHREDIEMKEANIDDDVELEVRAEAEAREEKMQDKFKYKQQQIEEQRRKLKDQLLFSSEDKGRSGKLMEDVKKLDDQLRNLMEEERTEQDLLLEERKKRREVAKQKRLLAFRNSQNDKTIETKLEQLRERHEIQGNYETEKIKAIIRKMKAEDPSNSPETMAKLYKVFEQLWNNKEAIELANMFGRQLAEKEAKLRALYDKNLQQKLMEKQAVKEKYRMRYDDLESKKEEISEEQYLEKRKELKVDEENDLKETDIKEAMNQKKEEFALRQDLEEKFAKNMGDMQDNLAKQKMGAIRELFGGMRDEEIQLDNRIKEMKDAMQREKDKKIKALELEKHMVLEKFEGDIKERFNTYDDIVKQQRETERLIKEKKGNIKRMVEERKKQIAEMKEKAVFTPEQERQMVDRYMKELKELESAMEAERNRQYASMRERLETKEAKREREKSYHKKRVAFIRGAVGRSLAQGMIEKIKRIKSLAPEQKALEGSLSKWVRDIEDREKSQKTTTFETLKKYIDNVGKYKGKGIEGVYLQGEQYQQYMLSLKYAKILQRKLEELHRVKANGALIDLKASLKIFEEDDYDRRKARPDRIGGGYVCYSEEGGILWDLFKFAQP